MSGPAPGHPPRPGTASQGTPGGAANVADRVATYARALQLRNAPAPLVRRFGLMAEPLEFRTNDPRLMAAAEVAFGRFAVPASGTPLVVRLVLDASSPAAANPPDLDARHLVHDQAGALFTILLGTANRAAVDAADGVGFGVVSEALAASPDLLRYAFIESMALSMLSRSRGYVPIHASCIVRDGVGYLLHAPAGTGKSTLAMAAARRGFGLLAEDVVFIRRTDGLDGHGPIELWGAPWTQRLMPDVTSFFPELDGLPARVQANGEHKFEVDIDRHLPGSATPRATAGPVVTLARGTGGPTRAEWRVEPGAGTPATVAAGGPADLEVLWAWDGGWTADHERLVVDLLRHGLIHLAMNGMPDEAVDALEALLRTPRPRARAG